MLTLIVYGLICGAQDVKDIWQKCAPLDQNQRRAIGMTRRNKKTGLLTMPGYGALNDLVNRIDPVELARALNAWLTENSDLLPKSLALDGKDLGAKGGSAASSPSASTLPAIPSPNAPKAAKRTTANSPSPSASSTKTPPPSSKEPSSPATPSTPKKNGAYYHPPRRPLPTRPQGQPAHPPPTRPEPPRRRRHSRRMDQRLGKRPRPDRAPPPRPGRSGSRHQPLSRRPPTHPQHPRVDRREKRRA